MGWAFTGNPPRERQSEKHAYMPQHRAGLWWDEVLSLVRAVFWICQNIKDPRSALSCALIAGALVFHYQDEDSLPGGERFICASHKQISERSGVDVSTVKRNLPKITAPVTEDGDERPIVMLVAGRKKSHGTCYMFRDKWGDYTYFHPLESAEIVAGYPNENAGGQKSEFGEQKPDYEGAELPELGGGPDARETHALPAETHPSGAGDVNPLLSYPLTTCSGKEDENVASPSVFKEAYGQDPLKALMSARQKNPEEWTEAEEAAMKLYA